MPEYTDKHPKTSAAAPADHIVCPFCALVCDDLSLSLNNAVPQLTDPSICPRARQAFERASRPAPPHPLLHGERVDWDDALNEAARLLEAATLPLVHGLVGDLQDTRAALKLAAGFGGVIDHLNGDAIARNLAIFHDSGWQVTSLGEARNRADLVVILGDRLEEEMPRLREKLFEVDERLHAEVRSEIIELNNDRLTILDQVRVLRGGRPLASPQAMAAELHQRLLDSQYAVFILGKLDDPQAELILRSCAALVRDINETGRAALLPLGGGSGDVTAQLASAWHNGFGIRTGFTRGYPEQDLQRFAGERLLREGETDLLVWISSLSEDPPPVSAQPQIVFGHPGIQFDRDPPDIFFPVAVPGVHRAGFLHRADGLRMLPLHALIDHQLPSIMSLCDKLLSPNREVA